MYDALNRGIERILDSQRTADCARLSDEEESTNLKQSTSNFDDSVVAWLNCDEQYLPGTLEFVEEYFSQHPDVDILFGDYLVVDRDGELLAFRKGYAPRSTYIQSSHLYTLSCAMFFRTKVFESLGGFDSRFKAVADEDFVLRALKAGFKAKHVRRYFSAFTYTGKNLGGGSLAESEYRELKKQVPLLLKLLHIPLNFTRWIEKLCSGSYFQRFPVKYSLYIEVGSCRKEFASQGASWRWPTSD
jgi:hypothetical protein